jgi:hypothetical protein
VVLLSPVAIVDTDARWWGRFVGRRPTSLAAVVATSVVRRLTDGLQDAEGTARAWLTGRSHGTTTVCVGAVLADGPSRVVAFRQTKLSRESASTRPNALFVLVAGLAMLLFCVLERRKIAFKKQNQKTC